MKRKTLKSKGFNPTQQEIDKAKQEFFKRGGKIKKIEKIEYSIPHVWFPKNMVEF